MRGLFRIASLQLAIGLASAKPCEPRDTEPKWADIPALTTLEWAPCYDRMECARLEVPMDYDDPDGAKVILAVIRLPATDKANYKGSVLFNSGGPNNSGVDWLTQPGWADYLVAAVGTNYDLVTWDPRSYSRSVPRISCWATEQRRAIWQASSPGVQTQYDDFNFLSTMRHRARIESSACVDMVGETGILEHVSSTHSAHDLHALMKALGQDKLRYLGQSYGCLLGTYFASMFPDEVERLVCDGNIDPREVVSGEYLTAKSDADLLVDFFAESCAADERCQLHEATAEAVRERLFAIIENARTKLAFIPEVGSPFDYILQPPTFSLALGVVGSVTGNPYTGFPGMALALRLIESGQLKTAENLLSSEPWGGGLLFTDTAYRDPNDPDAGRTGFFNKYPQTEDWTTCNDFPAIPDDLEAYKEKLDEVTAELGPLDAPLFAGSLNCMGKTLRAKGMYTGPFGGNTSHPIFFTNARVDPRTSARMAYQNSEMFSGSALLVYDNYGHSVMFESECVLKHINKYFQDGTLPPPDAKCADEFEIPWGGASSE